jgi:hypothetical protein
MPIQVLAGCIPAKPAIEVFTLAEFDFSTSEQRRKIDDTVLVVVDVGGEIAGDQVVDPGTVAGIRVRASCSEASRSIKMSGYKLTLKRLRPECC